MLTLQAAVSLDNEELDLYIRREVKHQLADLISDAIEEHLNDNDIIADRVSDAVDEYVSYELDLSMMAEEAVSESMHDVDVDSLIEVLDEDELQAALVERVDLPPELSEVSKFIDQLRTMFQLPAAADPMPLPEPVFGAPVTAMLREIDAYVDSDKKD